MNSNNLLTAKIPISNNQQNTTFINTSNYINQNINSSLGKSINNSIIVPEEKNITKIQNKISKNTNNNDMLLIKRGKITSSGSLLESSRSSKFNRVIKNGKKITNIDINDDCEDNQNDEDTESVISSNYSSKKNNNQNNLGMIKINENQLSKNTKMENNIIEEDIPFDTDEILN